MVSLGKIEAAVVLWSGAGFPAAVRGSEVPFLLLLLFYYYYYSVIIA